MREAAVLIKRTQHERSEVASRGSVAQAILGQAGGLNRRAFLRRSGIVGGGLAALSALSALSQVQPDRFPVSKPGLASWFVAAEAPGMARPTRARAAADRVAKATMRPGLRIQ